MSFGKCRRFTKSFVATTREGSPQSTSTLMPPCLHNLRRDTASIYLDVDVFTEIFFLSPSFARTALWGVGEPLELDHVPPVAGPPAPSGQTAHGGEGDGDPPGGLACRVLEFSLEAQHGHDGLAFGDDGVGKLKRKWGIKKSTKICRVFRTSISSPSGQPRTVAYTTEPLLVYHTSPL